MDKARYFTLSCKATGSLPLTFKWKKSGEDIKHFPRYQTITSSGHSSNLTIETLSPSYDGKYQCLVSNSAGGTFSRKLRLKVTGKIFWVLFCWFCLQLFSLLWVDQDKKGHNRLMGNRPFLYHGKTGYWRYGISFTATTVILKVHKRKYRGRLESWKYQNYWESLWKLQSTTRNM